MVRVVIAVILSAIIQMAWGFVFWTVLPFSQPMVGELPDVLRQDQYWSDTDQVARFEVRVDRGRVVRDAPPYERSVVQLAGADVVPPEPCPVGTRGEPYLDRRG